MYPFRQPIHGPKCIRLLRSVGPRFYPSYSQSANSLQDSRSRLSGLWTPGGGIARAQDEDGHSRLIRAGFLRQGYSGIFHMLPLGRRVQEKVEKLIDKHMSSLGIPMIETTSCQTCKLSGVSGASRLDLSSISSEEPWRKSGRIKNVQSELFRFKDRKDSSYLLSPTHEEEITLLIANTIRSYKELPIRLYQISRKYRDELRPRHGLLRSREFVMKDLYTFDYDASLALATYSMVRKAYVTLFDELKIPYTVAEADSGDMGGNLSHEFHFPTPKGEDHVISCSDCNYAANEELAYSSPPKLGPQGESAWTFVASDQISTNSSLDTNFSVWRGLSHDRKKLINVWYALASSNTTQLATESVQPEINTHAVKAVIPELDAGVEDVSSTWVKMMQSASSTGRSSSGLDVIPSIINLIDRRLPASVTNAISSRDGSVPVQPEATNQSALNITSSVLVTDPSSNEPLNLIRIRNGDTCSRCGGKLRVERTIELGHTFFLGSRYSEPLSALVGLPMLETMLRDSGQAASSRKSVTRGNYKSTKVPIQMGCYGIGVSRMIGAVAEILSDDRGLNWPRVIAPYELVVIPILENELDAIQVYDALSEQKGHRELDVILDDRELPFAWKIQDADLIGYPVVVVVGKRWKVDNSCEVQCRRLGVCEEVPFGDLAVFVHSLLVRL